MHLITTGDMSEKNLQLSVALNLDIILKNRTSFINPCHAPPKGRINSVKTVIKFHRGTKKLILPLR